jgi:hypothetical protein
LVRLLRKKDAVDIEHLGGYTGSRNSTPRRGWGSSRAMGIPYPTLIRLAAIT